MKQDTRIIHFCFVHHAMYIMKQTHPQQSSPVKRRPCVYFLSGFCRNGQSCPDYHGVDFDPSELEDLDSDAVCTCTCTALGVLCCFALLFV